MIDPTVRKAGKRSEDDDDVLRIMNRQCSHQTVTRRREDEIDILLPFSFCFIASSSASKSFSLSFISHIPISKNLILILQSEHVNQLLINLFPPR